MKITNITRLGAGVHAHVCPLCNEVHASSSDLDFMPEFSMCNCDRNGNKQPTYELFEVENVSMIRRNKYPAFTGEITMGKLSDIESIVWLDKCTSIEAASAMRKAAEFLIKKSNGKTP